WDRCARRCRSARSRSRSSVVLLGGVGVGAVNGFGGAAGGICLLGGGGLAGADRGGVVGALVVVAGQEGGLLPGGRPGRDALLGVDEGEHLVQPAFVADRGTRVAAAQFLQPGGGIPAAVHQGGTRVGHGAGEVTVGVAGVQCTAGGVVLQLLQLSERAP